eukprot:TRINITY_DN779_c0_g1_i1.p2 TRINITY_DN779_c0_g1~~TRINITY_DN779_c0_g1_i1.p2  ORF type:complete len:110 (-),score=9.41 TRINITY_DN779_c0_g1_i1:101-430(-)
MVATDVLVLRETEVEAVHTSEGDEEEPRSPLSHGGDNTAGGVHDKVDGIIRGSKVLGGDNGAFIAWHEHFRSTESVLTFRHKQLALDGCCLRGSALHKGMMPERLYLVL